MLFRYPVTYLSFRGDSFSSSTMLSLSGTSLPSAFLRTKEIVQSVRLGGAPCAVREAEKVLRVYGKIATLPRRGCSNSRVTVKDSPNSYMS